MEYKRVLAIGDIHGNFQRLLSLYAKIHFNPAEDLLIFLGDYIDRGPKSLSVLHWMMKKCQEKNVVALRGNHEQLFWQYFADGGDGALWHRNGGEATCQAIRAASVEEPALLDRCLAFIADRPCSFSLTVQQQNFFFCHAGVEPTIPLHLQQPKDLLWIRGRFYREYRGAVLIVVGHTPTERFPFGGNAPLWLKNRILLLDTGSYLPEGKISCVDVLTGTCWQSDDDAGEARIFGREQEKINN
jgi:serine/threonine protein phosphatase 1